MKKINTTYGDSWGQMNSAFIASSDDGSVQNNLCPREDYKLNYSLK